MMSYSASPAVYPALPCPALDAKMHKEKPSMTYTYEFDRVEPRDLFGNQPNSDYREIIQKRAKQGWRLVTIITSPGESQGVVDHYEMIFEQPSYVRS